MDFSLVVILPREGAIQSLDLEENGFYSTPCF